MESSWNPHEARTPGTGGHSLSDLHTAAAGGRETPPRAFRMTLAGGKSLTRMLSTLTSWFCVTRATAWINCAWRMVYRLISFQGENLTILASLRRDVALWRHSSRPLSFCSLSKRRESSWRCLCRAVARIFSLPWCPKPLV